MIDTVKSRLSDFREHKGIKVRPFEASIGVSNGYLKQLKNIPSNEILERIYLTYPELSRVWLLTGEGEMLTRKEETTSSDETVDTRSRIPYYEELQVSAGRLDVITQNAQPSGWVDLPGVTAAALFPVVGCSMKPDINPGDAIGITQLDAWDVVDPDKVYLVITNDERMIKHLAIDETDDSVIWCISPNYPKFKINKSDIKYIYRVSFCGKLM